MSKITVSDMTLEIILQRVTVVKFEMNNGGSCVLESTANRSSCVGS